MIRILLNRLWQTVIVLFGVTLITFLIMHSAPGHPLQANPELRLDPTAVERWLELQELDGPLPAQYLSWLSRLFRGDFGMSLIYNRPVLELALERLPATLFLTVPAFLLALGLAISCGTWAALRQGGFGDRLLGLGSLAGLSLPSFWLGIILMMLFSYGYPWLPAAGMRTAEDSSVLDILIHLILPLTMLVVGSFSYYFRYVRYAVLAVLSQDFIKIARARGFTELYIVFRYVLPNASLPIVTVAALSLPLLFTGALVAEYVFSWPGIGRWIISSTLARDYPVIMAVNLSTAALVALSNFLADLLYLLIDPRLRFKA
ncbi:MAG: ABC transporter permease [Dethiobacter sp.]|jgi:peptide/nickel transport system permease protein|nr:ABC transporter permease [Dethiobacter sp.]MBS3897905.1 ABC transporter permease [Dethiobacter sp.]MBS3982169.1 ABC transporter permease [Dethiobacter sp.]MCL4463032.1 ABC transporter permease [Bacillota bacterium]MCL5993402.1 ABC transporter permease [Bacillota bacterium]